VDVGEILIREDGLAVGRHGAVGGAHERGECFKGYGIRRKLGAGRGASALKAVALPAAVLDIGGFPLPPTRPDPFGPCWASRSAFP
jgi:hypothetical protein